MPWTRRLRARVSRLALDTEPPTMPGVFLDRGAYRPGARQPDADARAYEVMDLSLRCGAQLLARGTAAVDVESAVHAAATTLGLGQVEVDVTYNALWVTAVVDGYPVATSRVVRQGTPDYQRLTLVHQLLTDIVNGDVNLGEAQLRLAQIESARRAHGRRVTLLANAVLAGAVAVSLGSGWEIALAAAVTGLLVIWLADQVAGPRVPALFVAGIGGLVALAATALLSSVDAQIRPSLVVAAGIVVMLPGVALVGSVRDALVGFPLTAIGRAVDGTMVVVGIVAGVLVGLAVATAASVPMQIIPGDDVAPSSLLLRVAAGAMAAASAAVVYQAPWTLVGASLAIGAVGFSASTALTSAVSSTTLAYGAAAVVVGMAAGLAAQRARTLALVFVVPGILPLLPGLTLYRGSLLLTAGETVEGLVVLLEAAVRMLALASGALLGELLVSRRRAA
jgi:uncharacterized membrane protein YjjP (DUF1212 family)